MRNWTPASPAPSDSPCDGTREENIDGGQNYLDSLLCHKAFAPLVEEE